MLETLKQAVITKKDLLAKRLLKILIKYVALDSITIIC